MRFPRIVLGFLLLHWAVVGYAQKISVPELTPLGSPIVAKVEGLPDGARVAWKADAGASVINVGLGKAHAWAVPGPHTLTAVIAPKDGELIWVDATFAVEGDVPPPKPDAKTLRDLAGKDAAALASIYGQLLKDIAGYDKVALFQQTHANLLTDLGLADNGAAAEINRRLAVDSLAALKAALEGIVKELGAGPGPGPVPPPPMPAGKRLVVIVRESDEDTPDFGFLTNALRTGEEAKWLKDNGHVLAIHDDDDEDQQGNPVKLVEDLEALGPVPGLFVLDLTTKTVVHRESLPKTAPEVIDVVRAH